MSTNKRIAKRILSAVLTVLMLMSMVTIGMASASAATLELAETGATITGGTTFYLKPNSNWAQGGAWFAMYGCNGSSTPAWFKMEPVPGDTGVYQATFPAGQSHANVIFTRMNSTATALDWSSKWDQSVDLVWDGTNNCWGPNAGEWNNAAGTWSTYTPPVVIPEYSVTFNDGHFKVTGDAKVTEGEDYTFTVEATTGYEVTKVTCNDAELTAVDGTYTVADVKDNLNIEITVSEIVVVKTYSVMFIDHDGTVISSETVEEGAEAKIPADPTRAGYFFTGWSPAPEVTRDDETGKWITVNGNAVFTAQYKEDSNDTPIIRPPVEEEEEETSKWTVMFVDFDNTLLKIAKVEDGKAAEAPEAPARAGYTFTGWSQSFDNVTADLLVVAQYEKNASTVVTPTHGPLKIDITGGTSFTLNGRPQGTTYYNTKMPVGTSVTLVASTTNGNKFIGWINPANGGIVSTTETFTFTTSGNDQYKAAYESTVEGVGMVIFKNDKAYSGSGQILDMQYYASTDAISFPDAPAMTGYDFSGWNMTETDIQAAIANGENVTVVPKWTRQLTYVEIAVEGGSVTVGSSNTEGNYLANQKTVVTANAPEEGMKFAYWAVVNTDGETETLKVVTYGTEYTFYPSTAMNLRAVFVEESAVIDYEVIVNIDRVYTNGTAAEDGGKVYFAYSWDVPETALGVEYETSGIVAVNADKYDETTFMVGTSDPTNVYVRYPGAAVQTASNSATWYKSNVADGQTWLAKAFVQYRVNGEIVTVYSDVIEYTRVDE